MCVLYGDGYYRDLHVLTHPVPTRRSPVLGWTQDDADFHGAEAEVTLHLARNASGIWALRTYGDTVRARLAGGGGNVPRIPAGRLGSELQWHRDAWRASFGAVHYYRQDDEIGRAHV